MLIKSCGYDPMFMFTNSLYRDNQGTGNTNILALTRQFLISSWRWLEICMFLKDCIFSIFFKYNIYRLTCFWDGSYEIEDDFRIQLDAISWCGMHKWPTCQLKFLAFAILRHTRKVNCIIILQGPINCGLHVHLSFQVLIVFHFY